MAECMLLPCVQHLSPHEHLSPTIPVLLCRAIENGGWVLLDGANLCNPTVLDRLNPLLEPQGSLLLAECGSGQGGPRTLVPHPDFRLFLALDSRSASCSSE